MRQRRITGVMTVGQVAKATSLSHRYVQGLIDDGMLRGFRLPVGNRARRVLTDDLVRFAAENGIPLKERFLNV